MRLVRGLVLSLAALACLGAAKPAERPPVYTLSPELKDGALVALDVTIELSAGPDGRVRLELPDGGAGAGELWRNLRDLKIDGARSVTMPSPAERLIAASPGAPLTVKYRVVSAFDHDPDIKELETYKPLIRPTRFWIYGEAAFARPKENGPAVFHWVAPPGFGFASDLQHAEGRPMSLDQLQESVSVGGPELVVYRRQVGGAELRVASIGRFEFPPEAFVDMAARIVAGERAFWGGHEGPFLVALAPLKRVEKSISIRGEGRGDAFAIQAGEDTALDTIKVVLAHEYFHTWNSARLGGMHEGDAERADYWFSEGFTDFYARRLSLRMGVFGLDEFVADWNAMLHAYAVSPARGEPNTRVVADFWNDRNVEKLPYQRGAMLAAIWDRELRAKSGGKVGLDDVTHAMRDRAAALGRRSPKAPELFVETVRGFGLDVRGDVARIVEQGGPAVLPADVFGGCLRVTTGPTPRFEIGYVLETKNGVRLISRVEPGSAAYAAGLRSGMRVRRWSGYDRDYARPWQVWVVEGDQERLISYLPRGKGAETQQQLEIPKDLTPQARASCAAAVAAMR